MMIQRKVQVSKSSFTLLRLRRKRVHPQVAVRRTLAAPETPQQPVQQDVWFFAPVEEGGSPLWGRFSYREESIHL